MLHRFLSLTASLLAAFSAAQAQAPQSALPPLPVTPAPVASAPVLAPTPAAAFPAIVVDVAPLRSIDPASPYASPRDAARHRLRATLDKLKADQKIADGLRGIEQAVAADPDYPVAIFDLGVACAVAEKWEDAIWAYGEAMKLNPASQATIGSELERIRLAASMDASPDGAKKRRYDTALASTLARITRLNATQAIAALAEVAKVDSSRWEAPALIAGYTGDSGEYETAVKFLNIAIERVGQSPSAPKLREALAAAQREVDYQKTVTLADTQYKSSKWTESAHSYEAAWEIFPGRAGNGLQAGTAWLLADDTTHAANVLARLSVSPDPVQAKKAQAMLAALAPVEPAAGSVPAKPASGEASGSEPTRISVLLPDVRTPQMAILLREPLKFEQDSGPIHILDALSADPSIAGRAATAPLPDLPPATLPGLAPARELAALRQQVLLPEALAQTVSRAAAGRVARDIHITSTPSGASVFAGDETQPACVTPCILQTSATLQKLRLEAAGYQPAPKDVTFPPRSNSTDVLVPLEPIRGHVIVQSPGLVFVNGQPINAPVPFEISLVPGLYDFEVRLADHSTHVPLAVRADSRVRLPVDLP